MRISARVSLAALLAGGAILALTSPAAAAPGPHGGCAEFGGNVAGLATTLGPAFGATASGVATSGPRAFPNLVVFPEQDRLCAP